jgi:hypothetical protein
MRKIILIQEIDKDSFQPTITIKQKNDDGSISTLFSETLQWTPPPKYTKQEQEKIDSVNSVLSKKGMDLLTDDEIDYMLDPSGLNKRLKEVEDEMKDPEKLQKLAGFKVEKRIVPLD